MGRAVILVFGDGPRELTFWSNPKLKKTKKSRPGFIANRAKFKEFGANGLKSYRRRFTDYQVMVRAQICRQQRLRNRTRAEMAFCEILDSLGVLYESEAIFQNGDRFVLIDMYVKSAKIAFEIDGEELHRRQQSYDAGRDAWLLRVYKVRTVRITNATVFKKGDELRKIVAGLIA